MPVERVMTNRIVWISIILGNIYVGGYYNNNALFGAINLSSKGQADAFVVKYDPDGNLVWVKNVGGNNGDRITGISVDNSGNSFVSGYFESSDIQFGSTTLTNFYTEGIDNAFMARFDSNGNPVWANAINGKSKALGIALYGNNLYSCGPFIDDSLSFGASTLHLKGNTDFFLLHCDTDGDAKWVVQQSSGGESGEYANSITADPMGNIIIAGYFDSSPVEFGHSVLNTTGRRFDMFLASLNGISTGLGNIEIGDAFIIYPNPGNGIIKLENNNFGHTINIFDIQGKLVYSKTNLPQNSAIEINISFLPSGIYLAKLKSPDKVFSKKIIIRHL